MNKFTIPVEIRSLKNSKRVIKSRGRTIVLPSAPYMEFEKAALPHCPPLGIDYPINLKCLFYMRTKKRIDLNNALQFTDILVKAGTIKDDNFNIVSSFDGSRILYDKENPRIEIEITEAK